MRIKIGDPDATITGSHSYKITYTVNRAINYFDVSDELYWNSTGHEWNVPIANVRTTVSFEDSIDPSDIKLDCFEGSTGSTNHCSDLEILNTSQSVLKTSNLSPNQGQTIVIGWPTGIVEKSTIWQSLGYILVDNGIIILPFLVLSAMIYLWRTKGRDPKGRGTIIPMYTPPNNLFPAEIGTLVTEKVENRYISAEIIYLAIQGYLTITRIPAKFLKKDDFQLDLLKSEDTLKESYQKYLLKEIFDGQKQVKISTLKKKFYTKLKVLQKTISTNLTDKKYFPNEPQQTRNFYMTAGGITFMIGMFFGGYVSPIFAGSFVASGIIIFLFSFIMSAKTKKGVLAKEQILGLKMYLSVAERDRLKFHNAPKKDPKTFESLLPYAMVLGVEKAWAKQFEDIYKISPNWYHDPASTTFTALYLTSSLGDFRSASAGAVAAKPSSASSGGSGFSGGFSGGGFGGGGGGSW